MSFRLHYRRYSLFDLDLENPLCRHFIQSFSVQKLLPLKAQLKTDFRSVLFIHPWAPEFFKKLKKKLKVIQRSNQSKYRFFHRNKPALNFFFLSESKFSGFYLLQFDLQSTCFFLKVKKCTTPLPGMISVKFYFGHVNWT